MRLLLVIILLALASCDPVFAEDSVIVTLGDPAAVATISSTVPQLTAIPMQSQNVGLDLDPFHACGPSAPAINPGLSGPSLILPGADWKQKLNPIKDGIALDTIGKSIVAVIAPKNRAILYTTVIASINQGTIELTISAADSVNLYDLSGTIIVSMYAEGIDTVGAYLPFKSFETATRLP